MQRQGSGTSRDRIMIGTSLQTPSIDVPLHPLLGQARPLAAAPERAPPQPADRVAEESQRGGVHRHALVSEVPGDHAAQPQALLVERAVHASPELRHRRTPSGFPMRPGVPSVGASPRISQFPGLVIPLVRGVSDRAGSGFVSRWPCTGVALRFSLQRRGRDRPTQGRCRSLHLHCNTLALASQRRSDRRTRRSPCRYRSVGS